MRRKESPFDLGRCVAELRHHYDHLDPHLPILFAYSGGKDSSMALDILFRMLHLHPCPTRPIHLFFSDTGIEMGPVVAYARQTVRRAQEYADAHGFPLHTSVLAPEAENGFFALVVGRGYRIADRSNRWCTTRWKVDPQHAYMRRLFGGDVAYVGITGQRRDESPERRAKLENTTLGGMLKRHDLPACRLLTPIEHASTEDVWRHLIRDSLQWCDAQALFDIYIHSSANVLPGEITPEARRSVGEAGDLFGEMITKSQYTHDGEQRVTDKECSSFVEGVSEGENPGCSMSGGRSGCVFCGLSHHRDKALESLVRFYPAMANLWVVRQQMMQRMAGEWHVTRDLYRHGSYTRQTYNLGREREDGNRYGMLSPGGYSLYYRAHLLSLLLDAERHIKAGELNVAALTWHIRAIRSKSKLSGHEARDVRFAQELIDANARGALDLRPQPEHVVVPQEQLDLIAERWIEEGDLLGVCEQIAVRFGRRAEVSDRGKAIRSLGLSLKEGVNAFDRQWPLKPNPLRERMRMARGAVPDRFYTQAAMEIIDRGSKEELGKILALASPELEYDAAVAALGEIARNNGACRHFYPSTAEADLAREEWRQDRLSFPKALQLYESGVRRYSRATKTLLGYEGEDAWFWEKHDDWTHLDDIFESEHLTVAEKVALLEDDTLWERG